MTPDERKLFDSMVHGLRAQGWSRMDAEGEALDRIERRRGGCDRNLALEYRVRKQREDQSKEIIRELGERARP